MNIYRCKFLLTEHNNLESNIFAKAASEEEARINTKKIFESSLSSYGISNAKFIQIVTLSSEQEVKEYSEVIKKRNNTNKNLN